MSSYRSYLNSVVPVGRNMCKQLTAVSGVVLLASCASITPDAGPRSIPPTTSYSFESTGETNTSPWVKSRQRMERERRMARVDIGPARSAASAQVDSALAAATNSAVGWRDDLPSQPSYRTILDEDRTVPGSVSVGTVSHGTIEAPEKLPVDGPHHEIIERHRKRDTNWGTGEMVELLQIGRAHV